LLYRQYDSSVRAAAFNWLAEQTTRYGDVLPRSLLAQGFIFNNVRVPLVGPQGIFKPRILEIPLSISTTPESPYDDAFGSDGLLRYRYRGIDPNHRDNIGLRNAMKFHLPLVYLHGIIPGRYVTAWPVFVVGDDPRPPTPSFSIAIDDKQHLGLDALLGASQTAVAEEAAKGRRAYITSTVRVRLHQQEFRERVLEAYRRQCAFCRLRHEELLDAAHIIPDNEPEGDPVVRNGVALCHLHHTAFDKYFVGLRPDFIIEVRPDILREGDGPTLKHAIQGLHGTKIALPRHHELHPDSERLERRYRRFLEAASVL